MFYIEVLNRCVDEALVSLCYLTWSMYKAIQILDEPSRITKMLNLQQLIYFTCTGHPNLL